VVTVVVSRPPVECVFAEGFQMSESSPATRDNNMHLGLAETERKSINCQIRISMKYKLPDIRSMAGDATQCWRETNQRQEEKNHLRSLNAFVQNYFEFVL